MRLIFTLLILVAPKFLFAQHLVDINEFSEYGDPALCWTSIENDRLLVAFDAAEEALRENYSFREKYLGGSGNISCPSFVSLRLLTPDLDDDERGVFCLSYSEETDTIIGFAEGARDAYLLCKEPKVPLCERVNNSKDAAIAIVGIGAGSTAGASAVTSAAGVTAVTHSSGAVILTGSSGYIAGTLGSAAAAITGFLTAPATIAAAAVSVVAVGGAVYVCAE